MSAADEQEALARALQDSDEVDYERCRPSGYPNDDWGIEDDWRAYLPQSDALIAAGVHLTAPATVQSVDELTESLHAEYGDLLRSGVSMDEVTWTDFLVGKLATVLHPHPATPTDPDVKS